jgi:excisionase family DNA binding protein
MKKMVIDDTDRLLSIEEVAARLNISQQSVAQLLNKGKLAFIKCGTIGRGGTARRYVRKYTFNKFLAALEGQDLKDLIAE